MICFKLSKKIFLLLSLFANIDFSFSQITEIRGDLNTPLNVKNTPDKIPIFIFEKKYNNNQSDLMERLSFIDINYTKFQIFRISIPSGYCTAQGNIQHKLGVDVLEDRIESVPDYLVLISTLSNDSLYRIIEGNFVKFTLQKIDGLIDLHRKKNNLNKIAFVSFNRNQVTKHPEIIDAFFNLIKKDSDKPLSEFKDSIEIVLSDLNKQIDSNKPKLNIEIGYLNSLHLINSNFNTPNLKITENKFNELYIGLNVDHRIKSNLHLTNFIGFSKINWTTNIKSNQQLYSLGQHTDNFGDQFDLLLNTNTFIEKISYSTTNFNYGIGLSYRSKSNPNSSFYLKPQVGISIKSNITQELSDINFSTFRVYPILNFDTIQTTSYTTKLSGLKPNETFLNFNIQIGFNYSLNEKTSLRGGFNYFISNKLISSSNQIFEVQSNTINFNSNISSLNAFKMNGIGISVGIAQSF